MHCDSLEDGDINMFSLFFKFYSLHQHSLYCYDLTHVWQTYMYSGNTKMESTLFVPVNLSFSENLRCLKMPLLVGAISQKRWPSETCFVFAGQNVNSGKFKHLKYSENVKFTGTNYIDSILDSPADTAQIRPVRLSCLAGRFYGH